MTPLAPPPPRMLPLPGGRTLAYDDVGDPGGTPVLYLHGTPDCRLARHPDDSIAAALGVRLLAPDRPGAGRSDPAGPGALAGAVERLLDAAGVEHAVVLGWSSGGLAGLDLAARLGARVAGVLAVGTVPPPAAHRDPRVLDALGPARRGFVEVAEALLAEGTSPTEIGEEVAPHVVPEQLDAALALEVVTEGAGDLGRKELSTVEGAAPQLAVALVEAMVQGHAGLAQLIAEQLGDGPRFDRIRCPVELWHGSHDGVAPPEVGRWLVERLPGAELHVVEPGAHHLLFPRWAELLRRATGM